MFALVVVTVIVGHLPAPAIRLRHPAEARHAGRTALAIVQLEPHMTANHDAAIRQHGAGRRDVNGDGGHEEIPCVKAGGNETTAQQDGS